mmetsp:Transcript_21128/g.20306  ORF Transcript_21128/g.20306 Transcript_21128/m.20306 type:complete len:109 (-) Transcript_21128:25-351(-)
MDNESRKNFINPSDFLQKTNHSFFSNQKSGILNNMNESFKMYPIFNEKNDRVPFNPQFQLQKKENVLGQLRSINDQIMNQSLNKGQNQQTDQISNILKQMIKNLEGGE